MSVTTKLDLPDFNKLELGITAFNHASWVLDGMIHFKIRQLLAGGPLNAVPLPSPGEIFIVNSLEVDGPWEDHENDLAIGGPLLNPNDNSTHVVPSNWKFVTPVEGFVAWFENGLRRYTYNGSGWFHSNSIADLNGEASTVVRDRIIALLDVLRGHGVIET